MKNTILVFLFSVVATVTQTHAQTVKLKEGLALKYLLQPPTQKSAHPPLVILLHGYGSNEKDLFGLGSYFPKNYFVISARAPYNVEGGGYQWFEREIVNGKYGGKEDQLEKSRNAILKFIQQVLGLYGADAANVYVMGFSQGAIMSYEAGLTAPQTIKGIGILSGILPESLKPMIKQTKALSNLKIFIAHGTADTRLPYADGKAANDFLVSIGLKPEFHSYKGMEHSISPEVMADLVKWVN